MRNCIDGFTHIHAAGLGSVIDGNSINDGFEVALLVNGSTEGMAAGLGSVIDGNSINDGFEVALLVNGSTEGMAAGLVAAMAFEFADEIAVVAAAVGAETVSALVAAFTGNADGSLGLGASSAHDTSAPQKNPITSTRHTIES